MPSETLRALVERVVPADDYPSGWQAGAGDFLHRVLDGDRADRAAPITMGLERLDAEARARHDGTPFARLPAAAQDALIADLLAGDDRPAREFLRSVIGLTMHGYYGDPGNGGNRDAVSWDMVGYRILPDDARWPDHDRAPAPTLGWAAVAGHYDAV